MALVSTIVLNPVLRQGGLHVQVLPADATFEMELQRTVETAPGSRVPDPAVAVSIRQLPPAPLTGVDLIDRLPVDGALRFYRYRHVRANWIAGAWSNWSAGLAPYPLQLADDRFALAPAVPTLQLTGFSFGHNAQGSMPPLLTGTGAQPFSYGAMASVTSSKGAVWWTWSAFTIYRADGSTISVPASATMALPAAPTLSQAAGGALGARTLWVRVALIKDKMIAGIGAEQSIAVLANNLTTVASPAAVAGYDGWVPMVGSGSGLERLQPSVGASAPIAFGTNWTEPIGGASTAITATIYADIAAGGLQTGIQAWDLGPNATYYYWPYWDVAAAMVAFAGPGNLSSKSPAQAIKQASDGRIPLSPGAQSASVPATGGSTSGSGGDSTCLAQGSLVETRERGVVPAETVRPGEHLATQTGWLLVLRAAVMPQREFIRVQLGCGDRIVVTPEHPFTLADGGFVRARDLTLERFLVVRNGFAAIVSLERLADPEGRKVALTCEAPHVFWAGERRPFVLAHNYQINS